MDYNARYDCIAKLAETRPFSYARARRLIRRKAKPHRVTTKSVSGPEIRPSHLKARQRFPSPHPLVRVAKVLPFKLPVIPPQPTIAELEKFNHAELALRFLEHCRKFEQ